MRAKGPALSETKATISGEIQEMRIKFLKGLLWMIRKPSKPPFTVRVFRDPPAQRSGAYPPLLPDPWTNWRELSGSLHWPKAPARTIQRGFFLPTGIIFWPNVMGFWGFFKSYLMEGSLTTVQPRRPSTAFIFFFIAHAVKINHKWFSSVVLLLVILPVVFPLLAAAVVVACSAEPM